MMKCWTKVCQFVVASLTKKRKLFGFIVFWEFLCASGDDDVGVLQKNLNAAVAEKLFRDVSQKLWARFRVSRVPIGTVWNKFVVDKLTVRLITQGKYQNSIFGVVAHFSLYR